MSKCGICGATATRSCTHCGRFCCESHVTRTHAVRYAGAVCTDCASKSWVVTGVCLAIAGVVAFFVYFGVIKPNADEHDRRRREFDRRWKQTEPEGGGLNRKNGLPGLDR